MADRDRKDDPVVNQKRVLDATIARSEEPDYPRTFSTSAPIEFGGVMPHVLAPRPRTAQTAIRRSE